MCDLINLITFGEFSDIMPHRAFKAGGPQQEDLFDDLVGGIFLGAVGAARKPRPLHASVT